MTSRPRVILHPAPQRTHRIFSAASLAALRESFDVHELDGADLDGADLDGADLDGSGASARLDELLPEAFAIIGQPDLPRERLLRTRQLRAVCNVEGNFFPNVDYATCAELGVYVLGCGPAYAQAVAEYSLGLALDLARGISREDRAFRTGTERYVADGNADAVLLRGSSVGLIGFGNLGRALLPLLRAFDPVIRVHDPWLPDSVLREQGLVPTSLPEVLAQSRFVFVLATVTAESEHLLGPAELDLLAPDARLIVVSRAAVVDFDALYERLADHRFLAAVDVWPNEPMPIDSPYRTLEGLVFSGHRAGGIPAAFEQIGELVVDDLRQIARGLPPVRMQVAARELVGRYRNRPVT